MHISEIREINNYRNLSGKQMSFDRKLNFIIGENNIGKTNILELINVIFAIGKFDENDFFNILDPIEVKVTLKYDDSELGFFENNFDIEDEHAITIVARQDSVDQRIEYYHDTPTKPVISVSVIKKLNILYYYAQRMPSKEVDFRKTQGSGKVLNYLIQHSLEQSGIEEKDIIKKTKLSGIVKGVNKRIESLNSITGDYVNAYINESADKIISRILELGDQNGRALNSLGEGIQYAFNILLQIIEIIYSVKSTRKPEDFVDRLIENEDGEKLFPLFIVLDEPEIHQHPYRQRSLIKKIQDLVNNGNMIFLELLKVLFDIDGLTGQIFIATHSPNILLNDYKQFIRVYKPIGTTNNSLEIISGNKIILDDKLYKHLLRSFLYLKEAMFSKCIVFVEGDTENGAIPVFARRMGLDLDEKNIGVVKLDGADSVENCMKLCNKFSIKTIAVIDKDKKNKYSHLPDIYFTRENDFEEDVYSNFKLDDYLKYNKNMGMINGFIGILKRHGITFDVQSFKSDPSTCVINDVLQKDIMKEIRTNELAKLKGTKNASKSIMLAEHVTVIPTSFQRVIKILEKEVK
ncbi:ATP-dependent nuclease [Clostridium magnum]|uniref:DNA replication and repair protein RecF n=1 Tax=Clostridium magnum DSM 2767 TaxID=1121326 RepID=A0A162QJ88_9CLOT|nr:AAA family ATPase [Clostridium magnum]KZL88591.1 DNA replication and repair protein RecF [Clostridium magnum DSM 2767]SHI83929.1 putative ATP-dependent endonuclease of the OLD family [Clostridium magnum DSM 2767]